MGVNKKIVLLGGKDIYTQYIFNALNPTLKFDAVILEDKIDTKIFLKNRAKKLGWFTVIGQVAFQILVVPILKWRSNKRLTTLITSYKLDETAIPSNLLRSVSSVNDSETIQLLQSIQPDLVVVNGTRIISKKVLESVQCYFINTHAGITPKYRGVHGAYWALVKGDKANCGVTVHLVDKGIDTGGVLSQSLITVNSEDNFVTYPVLQLGAGIALLKQTIQDFIEEGKLTQKKLDVQESNLFYHPTLFSYFYMRFTKGIK